MTSVWFSYRRRCPMAPETSFLITPSLRVAALLLGEDGVTIRAVSEATDVRCPVCGEPSERVHSRYERTLADLPWARFAIPLPGPGPPVRLRQPRLPPAHLRRAAGGDRRGVRPPHRAPARAA